jgi:mercuric ion transport protein
MLNIKSIKFNTAMLPTVGVALLPKLTCPACWPAYAGLLSSLGISFVDYTPYLVPFTLIFLGISLSTMVYRAKSRHGYGPLLLGLLAGAVLMVGKFAYNSDAAIYTGLVILVAASLWNTWPKTQMANCEACATK